MEVVRMSGRINRSNFVLTIVIYSIFSGVALYMGTELVNLFETKMIRFLIKGLAFGFGYVAIKGFFVAMVQRLHDCNHTGWWALVVFVPYVDIAFLLALIFYPGTQGTNKYGEKD